LPEDSKSRSRRVSVAGVWRLFAPAAVLGLGLVAIGAGNGAGPSGAGVSVSRFVVFERPSGPVGYVLADENGHAIARSELMPEISVAGAMATAVQRGNSYRIELRLAPDAPARVVAKANGPPELAFSDGGTALAVTTGRDIQIVSVPAGTRRTLALGTGSYSAPAFSPDGSLLAFVRSTGGGCAGTYRADLQVVPIAGGPAVTVFRVPHPCSSQPQPVFTADGKRLAFVVDDNELVTVPVGGGKLVPVAPKLKNVFVQSVIPLPDGSGYIVMRKPQCGVSDVWQVDNKGVWKRLTVTLSRSSGSPCSPRVLDQAADSLSANRAVMPRGWRCSRASITPIAKVPGSQSPTTSDQSPGVSSSFFAQLTRRAPLTFRPAITTTPVNPATARNTTSRSQDRS